MLRRLCVVALCAVGLAACGTDAASTDEVSEALGSSQQGLACAYPDGYCPGDTVCAWLSTNPDEGLCRSPCINGRCQIAGQICCTQPNGAPYCNGRCL